MSSPDWLFMAMNSYSYLVASIYFLNHFCICCFIQCPGGTLATLYISIYLVLQHCQICGIAFILEIKKLKLRGLSNHLFTRLREGKRTKILVGLILMSYALLSKFTY